MKAGNSSEEVVSSQIHSLTVSDVYVQRCCVCLALDFCIKMSHINADLINYLSLSCFFIVSYLIKQVLYVVVVVVVCHPFLFILLLLFCRKKKETESWGWRKSKNGLKALFYQIISLTSFYKKTRNSTQSVGLLVLLVYVKCVEVFMHLFCFLSQAWRERYGVQGATGRSRAGYTELKGNQSSPETEIKKSGRD